MIVMGMCCWRTHRERGVAELILKESSGTAAAVVVAVVAAAAVARAAAEPLARPGAFVSPVPEAEEQQPLRHERLHVAALRAAAVASKILAAVAAAAAAAKAAAAVKAAAALHCFAVSQKG